MATIEEAFLAARISRPYYARALSAMSLIKTDGIKTVAVDEYWRLYYNPAYLARLTSEIAGAIIGAHEVEHLLRNHMARRKIAQAEPETWNIAADAEVNDDVPESELPPGSVRPAMLKEPDGLLAEEYLDAAGDFKNTMRAQCGSGSGGEKLDCERDDEEGGVPTIKTADAERLRASVARDVLEWEKNKRGTVPAGILVWANDFIKTPKTDWRSIFAQKIKKTAREFERGRTDYTWSRLPRRQNANFLRPGPVAGKPKIGIVVDTSGSMSDQGPEILGHVYKICRESSNTRVRIWACDTEPVEIFQRIRPKFVGGGGTDLRPAVKLADETSDVVVVLTDGETPWPTTPPKKQTIVFVLKKNETPNILRNKWPCA